MTKQIIVDENDHPIAIKARDDINYTGDIYRVTALWLTNSAGQVLMAQRSFQKKNGPGKWGPAVAGTVEEGETYESNIQKEAEEEIGLTGVDFVLSHKIRTPQGAPRNYFCQYFTAAIDRPADSFVLQEEEVETVMWMDASELKVDITKNPEKYVEGMGLVADLYL